MTTARFVVEGRIDYANIENGLREIKRQFREVGEPGRAIVFEREIKQAQFLQGEIAKVKEQLRQLATSKPTLTEIMSSQGLRTLRQTSEDPANFVSDKTRAKMRDNLKAEEAGRLNALLGQLQADLDATQGRAVSMVQALSNMDAPKEAVSEYLSLIKQVKQELAEGTAKAVIQKSGASEIRAELEKIRQQRADLLAAGTAQAPEKHQKAYANVANLLAKANLERAKAAHLNELILETEAKMAGNVPLAEKLRGEVARKTLDDKRQLALLREQEYRREAARPQAMQDERMRLAGTLPAVQELTRRESELLKIDTFDDEYVRKVAPELQKHLNTLAKRVKLHDRAAAGSAEQARYGQLILKTQEKIAQAQQKAAQTKVVPPGQGAFSQQQMTAEMGKMIPGIDRLFTGVFSDMARRFVATLQFSISAALIFGTQKLIKEFIQSAIEVERAFEDIRTALTFDIDAPEGSLEFERQVEGIRREVLFLSNQLNILPSDANEAAYVMVARFNDTSNAVTALKAQLLATKVSGISMQEVLRALTATAETFASSVLEANNGMTLQERLLERESVAARNYAKALDIAVLVQQRYGIETEDTLEGTARSAEVFRQMGFNLQETSAIVAATSRQLGQTGQQVAERLNRSLGQLTDPTIRDALLDLAAANEEFNLGIGDFSSGADAWKKIVGQFEQLERVAPSVAREILQIIGQRRELEAVAAALGTTDIQQQMVKDMDTAAGSAQQRFDELSRTMEEITKSIGAEFQSLAQNLEVLGGISSFKIILLALEGILSTVNKLVGAFGWLIDKLDEFINISIGGRGLASIAVQIGFITSATLGAARAVLALARAYKQLSQIQAISALTNFFSLGGPGTLASNTFGVTKLNARAAGAGITSANIQGATAAAPVALASMAAGAKTATSAIVGFASTAGGAATILAVAVLGIVASLQSLEERTDRLQKSFESGRAGMDTATAATIRLAREQGLHADETARLVAEAQLEAARNAAASAPSGRPGWMNAIGAGVSVVNPLEGTGRFDDLFSIVRAQLDTESVEGSREYWEELAREIEASIIQDAVDTFSDRRIADDIDTSGLTDLGERALDFTQGALDALNERRNKKLAELPGASPSDQKVLLEEINAITAQMELIETGVSSVFGSLNQETRDSVNRIKKRLDNLDTDIGLGDISIAGAAEVAEQGAKDLYANAEDFKKNGNQQEYESTLAEARQRELQAIELRNRSFERMLSAVYSFNNDREALTRKLEILSSALAKSRIGSEMWDNRFIQIMDIRRQILDADRAEIRAVQDHRIAMAKNFDARQKATAQLISELRSELGRYRGDKLNEKTREIDTLTKQYQQDQASEQTRTLVATQRLSGPILNEQIKIESQLIEANRQLTSQYSSYADKLEAQIKIRELLAQAQQEELARLTSVRLALVSVRDSMGELFVQLENLRQAAVLAAEQYGRGSAAANEAARAVKAAEAQMIDLVLELESNNRQLAPGFDVTNPLDAAEEAWIKAMRFLQIPDLGAAERAAGEVAEDVARANLLQAQYDDEMFSLKFQHEQGTLGTNAYISALQSMLATVDTSTHQGKELWMQINGLIEGLTGDIAGQAFNIPGQIRIPTLFEVRRAVQAESMGVNYQDNRQQDINVFVSDAVSLQTVLETLESVFEVEASRSAPGGAGITIGGF